MSAERGSYAGAPLDRDDNDWLRSELDAARHTIKELTVMLREERLMTVRLRSEVARLESELRVERAITRHDAEVLALCPACGAQGASQNRQADETRRGDALRVADVVVALLWPSSLLGHWPVGDEEER